MVRGQGVGCLLSSHYEIGDKIILKLNSAIYPKPVLDETICAFKELIDAQISESSNYFIIEIEKKNQEVKDEEIALGFFNYALSLIQSRLTGV